MMDLMLESELLYFQMCDFLEDERVSSSCSVFLVCVFFICTYRSYIPSLL